MAAVAPTDRVWRADWKDPVLEIVLCLVAATLVCTVGGASGFDEALTNRAAIERVYYRHRLSNTEPFEKVLPEADLRRLVKRDEDRAAALRNHYGVEVTGRQIADEVARIERSTKAPDTLAEIKAALGNDSSRYEQFFIRPIVVERELRRRFENDEAIHASQRRECEQVRNALLSAKASGAPITQLSARMSRGHTNEVTHSTWTLAERPAQATGPTAKPPYYFGDLPAQLRQVLTAQLRAPGDVSAVIESPESFLVLLAEAKDDKSLTAAILTLPKLGLDEWLVSRASGAPR